MRCRPTTARAPGTAFRLAILTAAAGSAAACGGSAGAEPADAVVEAPLNEANDPAADSLVRTWIAAVGGMRPYWELESARFTLHTELYDAASGRLRRDRPRYVVLARGEGGERARIERWEGDDFIAHGFDGSEPWARMNGEALAPGDMDYDQAAYVTSDVNYWIALPYKLSDPGVFLHDDGRDEAGRRIVRVTFGDGVGDHQDTWWYFFEDGRTWPVEVRYQEAGSSNLNRLRFEDVRTVDGYTFVGRRVHFDEEGRITKVLRTADFEGNPELEEGAFAQPSDSPTIM